MTSNTGIQRVVREILKHSLQKSFFVPFYLDEGELIFIDPRSNKARRLVPACGDIFLMLDSDWNSKEKLQITKRIRSMGAHPVTVVYDIIPLIYPKFWDERLVKDFKDWFHLEALESDAILSISKATMEDIKNYVTTCEALPRREIPTDWFQLGADFSTFQENISTGVEIFKDDPSALCITISTVEPRKGYDIALDAMEILWDKGLELKYLIIGKYGWKAEHLRRRIMSHPEYNRRLFWFQSASDSDIDFLYKRARLGIFPSIAEGFGLMIIEASHRNLPLVLSDIDVFKEIAGDEAIYFEAANARDLADKVELTLGGEKRRPNISSLTWGKATEILNEKVLKISSHFSTQQLQKTGKMT